MQLLMILLAFQINSIKMNKTLILLSIAALMLFACKAKTTESAEGEVSSNAGLVINPEALVQMDLTVEGMTCTGCENTINTGVSNIAGVLEVTSSFQEGKTIVKFDSTQTSIEMISDAISGKGYVVKGYEVHAEPEVQSPVTE